MVANVFPPPNAPPPLPTLGVVSKGKDSTVSEHGHVAYQLKGNHKCSKMVANIFSTDPNTQPTTSGDKRSKFIFFRAGSCCISLLPGDSIFSSW